MEQAGGSSEQPEGSKQQTEQTQHSKPTSSGQTQRSEPTSSGQTQRSEPTSSGQTQRSEPTSSGQTQRSEPTSSGQTQRSELTSSGQTQRSEPTSSGQTQRSEPTSSGTTEPSTPMSSGHEECSSEQAGCSMETECSCEQPASTKPPENAGLGPEAWSEPWLEHFAEQLSRVPPLWRASHSQNLVHIKPKSARGFAYLRLLSAIDPRAQGEVMERLAASAELCKEFFKQLRQKMREAAAACLSAGPDEALRRCPAWVRRADSFLNQMPLLFAHLNAQNMCRQNKKRAPAPAPRRPALSVLESPAGAALMRRVVRGVRREGASGGAGAGAGAATRAVAAAVAARLGDSEDRVYALWCGMRKLSLFKLRALLARGDACSESGRLDALDWAIVDLAILHGVTLVTEASYQNFEQLSALLGTFHLVQRFKLERAGHHAAPHEWAEAARWYSRNRVQMSALGLQKRWYELKLDTRRRFLARLNCGPAAPPPLPLHQAIARRYEHVVVGKSLPWWKRLVAERRVAALTSERGPAPGEPAAARARPGDDSDSDGHADADTHAAPATEDDDDITIVEKTLETIDLSEDKNDEDTSENDSRVPKSGQAETDVSNSSNILQVALQAGSRDKTSDKNRPGNTNVSRIFDKTIDVNKEIVDLDAPSPEADVLQALEELDVNNIQTTILFESDEDDVKCIDDAVSEDKEQADDPGVNEVNNESHSDTNRHRRESSDSGDGNLVIDCEDSNSARCDDVGTTDTLHLSRSFICQAIEREMLPEPLNKWPAISSKNNAGKNKTQTKGNSAENGSSGKVDTDRYPLLTGLLNSQSVFDKLSKDEKNMKVYYSTKRFHVYEGPKQYRKRSKVVSVGRNDVKRRPCSAKVNVSELVRAAKMAEGVSVVSEVGSDGAGDCRSGESEEEEGEEEFSAIDPKLLMYAVVLLRRIDEELPLLSRHCSPSPPPTRLSSRDSPPPPPPPRASPPTLFDTTVPRAHPHSLFHYFAATLSSKFVFHEKNIPLLKQCRPCAVVLRREELGEGERRVGGNRVAKKVELPDIEEVRRNNRSMLTAQVAPLAPRREGYVSSPEPPSCSSDSDWTPDGDRPRPAEPSSAERPPPAAASAESTTDEEWADAEAASRGSGPTSDDLGKLLNDLLAQGDNSGVCNHESSTGLRGPVSSVYAATCARCAARVLAAPPTSAAEARLQRRVLRRLARAQPTTTAATAATASTAATTTVTTAAPTAPVASITAAKATGKTTAKSKKSRAKSKRPPPRPRSPSPSPSPRPPSPADAEAAAREWLRQKNMAAEMFGVKPRSYKRAAPPAPPKEPPATLQPVASAPSQTQNQTSESPDDLQIVTPEGSVLPLTEENLARHSQSVFRLTDSLLNNQAHAAVLLHHTPAPSAPTLLNQANASVSINTSNQTTVTLLNPKTSTPTLVNTTTAPTPTPALFNPHAVADIKKKLVALAPPPPPPADLGPGFNPVITNIHSLAKPKTQTANKTVLNFKKGDSNAPNKKDVMVPKNYVIIPAPNRSQTGAPSVRLRPQSRESEVAKTNENIFVSPPTPLPQVVNVAGNIHLPPSSGQQGLHLIVSQKSQLTNVLNQPNMVVSGNLIQSVQSQQVSVMPGTNYIVTSMAQPVGSQPLLVSCPTPAPPPPPAPSTCGVFPSAPGRSQTAPLLVRSVQAGPPGASHLNMTQHILIQQNVVTQQDVAQNVVIQQNVATEHNVAQHNMALQNVAQHNMALQNVAQHNMALQNVAQHDVTQLYVMTQQNVAQQNVAIQHNMTQQNLAQQNVAIQFNVAQQNVAIQHNVAQQNVAQYNVIQQNVVTQQNVLTQQDVLTKQNVAQENVVTQQNAAIQQNVAQHNVIQQNVVTQQNFMTQQSDAIQHNVAQHNVIQQNVMTQQNVLTQQDVLTKQNVAQPNVVTQQNAAIQENVPQHNVTEQNVMTPQNVGQQNVVTQHNVAQQNAVTQHASQVTTPAQDPKDSEQSDDASKDSDASSSGRSTRGARPMSASLEWGPGVPARLWARHKEPTSLRVLCAAGPEPEPWRLAGFLLVSEQETPPPPRRAAYWALRPRLRLLPPGEESPETTEQKVDDPASPPGPSGPTDPPAPPGPTDPPAAPGPTDPPTAHGPTDPPDPAGPPGPAGCKTWLKVKAFARMAPEEPAEKETPKEAPEEAPKEAGVSAPARVFVNNLVYQKLSDQPLLYAKLLVVVRGARACRALLARGAALQLYCLRTGRLFPLQAEPKEDVSRITLSGDEDVSDALVSLARQLYRLHDTGDAQKSKKHSNKKRLNASKDTAEEALDRRADSDTDTDADADAEPAPTPAKRPRRKRGSAERRTSAQPPPPPTDVIELSDED